MRVKILAGHHPRARVNRRIACMLLATLVTLPGCVSKRVQSAPKKTPPAVPLNLNAQQPPIAVVLNTVIVFEGPGSWKREAYWDEYVVSIVNQGQAPITIDDALLSTSLMASQTPGSDPWAIEAQSHKILKDQTLGRQIVAGAGAGSALYAYQAGALALAGTAIATGSAAAVAGATVALVALPVFLVGSVVREITAHQAIEKEFKRRRLALPVQLQPGEMRQGSLFFPITPGPQRLEVVSHSEGLAQSVNIDLTPLSNLHFKEDPTGAKPPQPTAR